MNATDPRVAGRTVASYLWRTLASAGVNVVYGLPGTTNLPPLEVLRRENRPRFVTTRHEQAAGHMADASARMGAVFGVAFLDLGPGLANATSAILAAQRDSSPILIVAGNEERRLIGREVWHEMPEVETFGALTKFVARVTSADAFPRLLRQAVTAVVMGRPGPALLSVPKDLWLEPISDSVQDSAPLPHAPRIAADPKAVREILDLLAHAKRPLLLAGGGCRRAENAVRTAAERIDLPVVTSLNGRGVLPEDHELCLGHCGRFGQRQASMALREADLVLAMGCRLDDLTTNGWTLLQAGQRVIQVDIDGAMLGRNWPADLTVQADAGAFLDELTNAATGPLKDIWRVDERVAERRWMRQTFLEANHADLVKPQAVMRWLEKLAAPDHTVTMGGGRFQQFAGEWLVRSPGHFFYAANSGALGFALPAAIAVALEHPERQTICITGDGDFMMNVQELETGVREGANMKCVVLNDFAYGAMKARQSVPFATDYGNPNFGTLAELFGGHGRQLARGNEVEDAVHWLMAASGVAVLDVVMDPCENRSLLFGHDIGDKV